MAKSTAVVARKANPVPPDRSSSSDHLSGFLEAFYPGAMKQAASFSTKCPKGNDIHQEFGQTFLEESVKIAPILVT